MGCSKQTDPKPVYDSIEGKWSFTTPTSSGNFTILKVGGNLAVTEGGYVINDVTGTPHSYTVGNKWLVFTPVTGISLIDSNGGNGFNSLAIEIKTVSSDFITMTASRISGYHGSFQYVYDQPVEIKRTD